MKGRNPRGGEGRKGEMEGPKSTNMKMRKRNMIRMGGTGLSLEAFANAKSTRTHYNPALIKKQKEFYKNAKYVSKFKKKLRQPSQQNDLSSAVRPLEEDKNETGEKMIRNNNKKSGSHSLQELYQKQREEAEKIRMEKEAAIKAKKEEQEMTQGRRKAVRHQMLRKTQRGQPLMKYRMEHLLQEIQGSR